MVTDNGEDARRKGSWRASDPLDFRSSAEQGAEKTSAKLLDFGNVYTLYKIVVPRCYSTVGARVGCSVKINRHRTVCHAILGRSLQFEAHGLKEQKS